MAIYRDLIGAAIKRLFARGFAITECMEVAQNFGDARIVIASDKLMLRFTSDRGQLFVSELYRGVGRTAWAGP
jgi:hypothetical protein